MKQKFFLLMAIPLIFTSCKQVEEPNSVIQTTISNEATLEYPKRVNILNSPEYATDYFLVYLGSDGHEYQMHTESNVVNQFTHYGNCIACRNRNGFK